MNHKALLYGLTLIQRLSVLSYTRDSTRLPYIMVKKFKNVKNEKRECLIPPLHLVTPLEAKGPHVPDGHSTQRATATNSSRAEVKLGPCAQLPEAGS